MKKNLSTIRTLLLIVAVAIMAISAVPERTTAAAEMGPCSDDGCMGGNSFCDYVEVGGEWKPCNMTVADQ